MTEGAASLKGGLSKGEWVKEMADMKIIAVFGLVALVSACAGRDEPGGTFLDPVCMPDGSVAMRQLPNSEGDYTPPIATKANCPWNKPAAK